MNTRAPNPRAAWPSSDDMVGFNGIVILIGIGVGAYLLWTYHHTEISAGVMAWRHWEIEVLRRFTDRFDLADAQMMRSSPSGVTVRHLWGISDAIGRYWRLPACVLMVLLAIACMARNAPSRFRRQFDIESLIREQAQNFTTTSAFLTRKLQLVALREGDPRPADYALTPTEWIKRYAASADGTFDEALARRALRRQLGPRWHGHRTASPQARVLFASFALHLALARDEALALLGAASQSLAGSASDLPEGPAVPLQLPAPIVSQADVILAGRPDLLALAAAHTDRHAWAHPALMSLLNAARLRAGVLAPAHFAWLKLVDRHLWYALHALGFESEGMGRYLHPNPCAEALAARDHWALERAIGRPVERPRFEQALLALHGFGDADGVASL